MAGDIISLTKSSEKATIDTVNNQETGKPIGEISSIFFNDSLDGVPRRDDLFSIRVLGQTTQIEWLKDIIKHQVASTSFHVKPELEDDETDPSDRKAEAADNIEKFLEGNFNTDNQSFDDLIKIILDDTLDFNSGIIELVTDNNGNLDQIVARDGLTFTKNVGKDGLLPSPDSGEPAFFQFSPAAHAKSHFTSDRRGIDVRDLGDELGHLPFSRFTSRESIPFGRDQIVWFSESPTSYDPYGRGRTQKVKKAAEIMINGDNHRNKFFLENEFHKGFMNVNANLNQDQVDRIKNRFKQDAGNEYEMPVIGAEEAEWVSIDPEPEKMQFLESQKWYSKLVVMAYGLNEAEAGLHDNANLSVSEEMKFNVWRRTTQPLLEMIERKFNNEILPFMQEYEAVDGEVVFEFDPQNRFLEQMETDLISDKLENDTTTLNEAREQLGKDTYGELGDMPRTVFEQLARNNPTWVAEQLTELEDIPEGDGGGQNPFENLNINLEEIKEVKKDNDNDTEERKASNGEKDRSENSGSDEKVEESEADSGGIDPVNIQSYSKAFENKDKVLEVTKDALRNQRGFDDVEGIVAHKDEMKKDVSQVFDSINLEQELEKEFPEESQENGVLVNADQIVESIDIRERLGSVLETNNLGALELSAESHEQDIEEETEKRFNLPEETKVEISFSVLDTFTADIIRQEALSNATEIESTIKHRIRNAILTGAEKGEGINDISDRVNDVKGDLSDSHSELVARTETLQSSRKGSQALAESTDLVAGKEWLATDDSRTRAWHSAMDGEVVPKDQQFTVPQTSSDKQPSNYPRTARVVGEDQPFNCRCSQAPVLSEDMPENATSLSAEFDNVELKSEITDRQLEVFMEHSKDGENSFEEFWKRVNSENTPSDIVDKGIVGSRATVYSWNK